MDRQKRQRQTKTRKQVVDMYMDRQIKVLDKRQTKVQIDRNLKTLPMRQTYRPLDRQADKHKVN